MAQSELNVTVLLGDPNLPDSYKRNDQFNPEDLENVEILKRSLAELDGYRFTYFNEHPRLLEYLQSEPPDLVLNLCDTGFRNEATLELHIPALLDLLGIPCTGAGPAGIVLSYDKGIVRAVAAAHRVAVPFEVYLEPGQSLDPTQATFPALIKPACADGSLGITQNAVVEGPDEAARYLEQMRAELPGRAFLVQEFLSGNEYGIGLVGNPEQGFTVLPPLEVDYSGLDPRLPRILGYESKALPDSPYWTDIVYRHAQTLPEVSLARMVEQCEFLFARLQCRDYARFDFRADAEGTVKLMEVNTNPAWAHDAKLALMAGFAGMSHGRLLGLILEAAQRRAGIDRGLGKVSS